MVVYINVPQQQNIFYSWMKRPSDDSSRRIIPVQFWEVLHTYKYFFLKLKIWKYFFYILFYFFFGFLPFFWIFENFVIRFNPEKASGGGGGKYPSLSYKKNYWFQRLTFENVHKGPRPHVRRFAICGTSSLFQSLWN